MGAIRKNRHYMWPWVIINIMVVVFLGTAFEVAVFGSPNFATERTVLPGVRYALAAAAILMLFLIGVIRISAVCSYMRQLYEKDESRQRAQITV